MAALVHIFLAAPFCGFILRMVWREKKNGRVDLRAPA